MKIFFNNDNKAKLLFYAITTNNNRIKIDHMYENNISINYSVLKKFYSNKIKYTFIFDNNYPFWLKQYPNAPYLIFYHGDIKEINRKYLNKNRIITIKGKNNYSYNDYKIIKTISQNKCAKKYLFLCDKNNDLSLLLAYFCLKKNIDFWLLLNDGILESKYNYLFNSNKLNIFSIKLFHDKSNFYMLEKMSKNILWIASANKLDKWYRHILNLDLNVYYPKKYNKDFYLSEKLQNKGFISININKKSNFDVLFCKKII